MRTAYLLGIPAKYVPTAKSAIAKNGAAFNLWSVKYVPTNRPDAEISVAMLDTVRDQASKTDDAHVFGFSTQSNRRQFEAYIKPFFRFRWFDHNLLKCLGSPDPGPFIRELSSNLEQEFEWSTRVKPANLDSPLLLPEGQFEAKRKHRDLWRHASAYGDPQNIVGAEKAINEFRSVHRQKVNRKDRDFSEYEWVDDLDRIYNDARERHAEAPFPRNWKFSFRIAFGFHFDVQSRDGRKFFLVDASGTRCEAKPGPSGAYLNVDPHGFVRV